jgi:hypothetical protein
MDLAFAVSGHFAHTNSLGLIKILIKKRVLIVSIMPQPAFTMCGQLQQDLGLTERHIQPVTKTN